MIIKEDFKALSKANPKRIAVQTNKHFLAKIPMKIENSLLKAKIQEAELFVAIAILIKENKETKAVWTSQIFIPAKINLWTALTPKNHITPTILLLTPSLRSTTFSVLINKSLNNKMLNPMMKITNPLFWKVKFLKPFALYTCFLKFWCYSRIFSQKEIPSFLEKLHNLIFVLNHPSFPFQISNSKNFLDLGVDIDLIKQRTLAVLKFKELDEKFAKDADMSGPLLIALAFGSLLLMVIYPKKFE